MFENLFIKQLNADEQESAGAETAEATTATTNEPAPTSEQPEVFEKKSAHDDFDWSIDKRNVTVYN